MTELTDSELLRFVAESNRIEGITREPTHEEFQATRVFLGLTSVSVGNLEVFVAICAGAGARIRDRPGMDVRVGNHIPPRGGFEITPALRGILGFANAGGDPFDVHLKYETLHPFTDGNGRSGRALWAWQMLRQDRPFARIGFLHSFYYQALSRVR